MAAATVASQEPTIPMRMAHKVRQGPFSFRMGARALENQIARRV